VSFRSGACGILSASTRLACSRRRNAIVPAGAGWRSPKFDPSARRASKGNAADAGMPRGWEWRLFAVGGRCARRAAKTMVLGRFCGGPAKTSYSCRCHRGERRCSRRSAIFVALGGVLFSLARDVGALTIRRPYVHGSVARGSTPICLLGLVRDREEFVGGW